VGRQLLDAAWAMLRERGIGDVTVNVLAGNTGAEGIYRCMGVSRC
jgi:ribosomal protein S18 acetylase RimI-like enzyme